ncbi:MAG: glutathione S-transferase family protein [Halioglobus sp.]
METILIYEHPLSPYAQKVKIALYEKGIPFELRTPEGMGTGSGEADFVASSPRMEVPSFVQGDIRIFDSTVILEYIEDVFEQPRLLPQLPLERARVRMLEEVMDTHVEAILWGLAEIRFFGRAQGSLAATIEAAATDQIAGWYAWLTKQLGDANWFNGAQFGWGDVSVVPYVNGLAGYGFPPSESLSDWLTRVNERDSVRRCQESAMASAFDGPNMDIEAIKAALAAGLFKREYRDHRLEWMIKSGGLEVVQAGLEQDNIRFTKVFT